MSRLYDLYQQQIIPELKKQFNYQNVMAIPKLTKIVVNVGLGEAIQNPKLLDSVANELGTITGQRPVINLARKSIAAFKLRKGMAIGCSVTLRANRMYEFFDRLVSIALPRVRDFRGLSPRSFDGRGNYTLGLRDQLIFPEIDYSKVNKINGMNVCIVTNAKTDNEARTLLGLLGLPFRK
ncbi:MAG: 50S ribosomal protein L5 [Acidobacteriia bacterium]|jgi:large subunit ribosomal protein L5|nr:50S ribosomal protein L5 [Terriglobia bacterium]